MTLLEFALGGLATYRLALLVSKESGPARIFKKLRNIPPPKSATREGISCHFCVGIHSSALVTTFFWWTGRISGIDWPLYWLATAGVSVVLHMAFTSDFKAGKK